MSAEPLKQTKTCTKCKETKPINCFYRTGHCKECRKKWKNENNEKMRGYRKKWNEANKEKVREYSRNHSIKQTGKEPQKRLSLSDDEKKQRERIIAKLWRDKNPEKVKEYNKNKWKKHKDSVRKNTRNRRARLRKSTGMHTVSEIRKLLNLQKNLCAVCKINLRAGYHVDHIIPLANGGSNDKGNLQILCASCNTSKGAKDPIKFMQSRGFLI